MKLLITLTFASLATAARLDTYLPPKNGASTINTGLQTPLESDSDSGPYVTQSRNYGGHSKNYASQGLNFGSKSQSYASQDRSFDSQANQSQDYENQAQILRYENEIDDKGWHYAYETSDGTKVEQDGRILPGLQPEEGSLAVTGSYSYIGDDGQTYTVTYTADENGFHPSGDHLPTPPPIPEEILKSLQLTAGGNDVSGHYDSQRSSYDADAGY
ncbi:endocuticle structural glycoprotein SgAbd-2-like [Pararge aegeria]|uniref:endocuticle structural glycoprotein SgAbd-2-like n=1 Tax=Pararge aegeria TaxID=116150 RepID=UPI0019D13BF0|nr:endocuticle structural glycoprotein SgAbd-2-like [Pararge aegeria]